MDHIQLFGFETRPSEYFYVDCWMLHLVSYAMRDRILVPVLQYGPGMMATGHWMSRGYLLQVRDC